MRKMVTVLLIIVGIIHLLPLSGALDTERLSALYGVTLQDPNLVILMRHRAVLFGLLGLFLLYAAFRPAFQAAALIGGIISVGSFLWIATATGGYNPLLGRVVAADWIALACLLLVAAILARDGSGRIGEIATGGKSAIDG